MIIRRLLLALFVLILLAAGYFWAATSWSYSSGERAGWIQKLSEKGWLCKTWEGELALVSIPGSSSVEKFYFTVANDAVAADLSRMMGRRVSLHYEEKVGLPTTCFGDTRHYVTRVTETSDISISPGVVVPQRAPAAPAAPGTSAAPAVPAASTVLP